MAYSSAWKLIISILCFGMLTSEVIADTNPEAAALLQKVTDTYKAASSFSCEGQYQVDMQTSMPVKLKGSFKILFARPDEIRIDWTDTKWGGEVANNSVFTQDKTIFFYWGLMGKVAPQKDMEAALGMAAGISHGISHTIPSLLRGQGRLFTFDSLKPLGHVAVNGTNCLLITGTTKFYEDMEVAVDPASFAILQLKTTQLIKSADTQKNIGTARQELARNNPELATKLRDVPATPDFTSVEVTTYTNPVFDKELAPADFVYPVPADTKKVDNVLK